MDNLIYSAENLLNVLNEVILNMKINFNAGIKPRFANYPNVTRDEQYKILLQVCQSNDEQFAIDLLNDEQIQIIIAQMPRQIFIVAAASNNLLIANHLIRQDCLKENFQLQNSKDFVLTGFSLLQHQELSQTKVEFTKNFMGLVGVRQHILSGEYHYLSYCCNKELELAGLEILNYSNIENYVANNDNMALLEATSNSSCAMALKLLDFKNVRISAANHNNLALIHSVNHNLTAVTLKLLSIPAVLNASKALPFLLNQIIRQKDEASAIRLLPASFNDFMNDGNFTAVKLNLAVTLKLDQLILKIVQIPNVLKPERLSILNLETYQYLLNLACQTNNQSLFKNLLHNNFERFEYKKLASYSVIIDTLHTFLAFELTCSNEIATKLNNKLTDQEKIAIHAYRQRFPRVGAKLIAYKNSIKINNLAKQSLCLSLDKKVSSTKI